MSSEIDEVINEAVARERAAVVTYLRAWAANMRQGAQQAERVDGRASLFTPVGLAEHAGIDLEASADLLDEVAEQVEQGSHTAEPGRPRPR